MIGQKYTVTNGILCIPPPTFPGNDSLVENREGEDCNKQINMQMITDWAWILNSDLDA